MRALDFPDDQPIHKSAQRLRWFIGAFKEQTDRLEAETGNAFAIDNNALAETFATWLKSFEAQKPARFEDKAAYVGFAAGLMLRTLLLIKPVLLVAKSDRQDDSNPAYFWPEGYLYVAFCLNVRGLVLENDFHGHQDISDARENLQTWWSFKENIAEDPSLAIAFLDLFAGEEPDWTMPGIFQTGRYKEIAGRFFTPKIVN